MDNIKIALAGNPNSGKTTLFNALTGSNQFVGNWPGVTVEKKEGKLKKQDGVIITDLPGIYSLSPYTLEEVVSRKYLLEERPDAILNIIDATNLERNLYLTTQLIEIGIPVVIALNMMDIIKKNGDKIDINGLSKRLGVKIVEISALKNQGIMEAAEEAIKAAKEKRELPVNKFSENVEKTIDKIEGLLPSDIPSEERRWYAIKAFERDSIATQKITVNESVKAEIESLIDAAEKSMDDDSESIITNERYTYIADVLKGIYKKKKAGELTTSDKIDKVLTNRWLALPIFAVIMFIVYFVSVTTVGTLLTDWVNDGVFGDGFHLFGIGQAAYKEESGEYGDAMTVLDGFITYTNNEELRNDLDAYLEGEIEYDVIKNEIVNFANGLDISEATYEVTDEETFVTKEVTSSKDDLLEAIDVLIKYNMEEPDPAEYGVWVKGIPVLLESGLDAINCADWLKGLILDGIVAGVGAVLGFVPQMLILFIFLAFLEACGYMARIAFVLDRIFRRFGLSGKSFIPMLIGTGCGVPGIMASRTIESENDRRMTVITTTFIPCGAKLPFIAMIAGIIFGGAWWVAPFAYFLGMFSIIVSGIILKKTKMFSGDPAPFVMELPVYHWPTVKNVLMSMWERGWAFIKKAGTIILLSTIVIWFLSFFGVPAGEGFRMLSEDEMEYSILASIGNVFAWIFAPIGFGTWQATVASVTGIVAKENIVGTMSILYGESAALAAAFTKVSGLSFLIFNLLCAPCFAAIGAIKREMANTKWTWFAIGYQCGFAYLISFIVFHIGNLITGFGTYSAGFFSVLCVVLAFALLAGMIYLLVKPQNKKLN